MTRLPLFSPLDRILFLKAQPYLESQPPDVLTALASYTEEQFYSAGSIIYEADSRVDRVLFLARGRVELGGDSPDGARAMVVEAPGVVGIVHHYAGVEKTPRVRASTDTLCLEISASDLDQIAEDHFSLLLQFARRGAQVVLESYDRLGNGRPPERGFDEDIREKIPAKIDLVERLALARHSPLLIGTNLNVLGQLLRDEELQRIAAGEAIWHEGDEVDSMALVLDGRFRTDGRMGLAIADSGATLGAWEILLDTPHIEGWVAETPSRVLMLRRERFTDLLEDHFDFAQSYLRRSCEAMIEAWALEAAIERDE